jgi:hypothetical protein
VSTPPAVTSAFAKPSVPAGRTRQAWRPADSAESSSFPVAAITDGDAITSNHRSAKRRGNHSPIAVFVV